MAVNARIRMAGRRGWQEMRSLECELFIDLHGSY
jgi:hypothetical protein